MKAPRKAIILSAGFGTRMVPLTNKTPKPMMSIWGRPAIDHILTMLEKWGVKEVLVNIHHAPQPLLQYLTRNHKRALSINISFEHEIMGTGGAIRRAEWFIDKAPFWIINGDIAVDVNPKPLLDAYQRMHPSAVLWIKNDTGPRTIIVKRNIVQTFKAPSPGINDTYTFCGLHLVSPTIISAIPKKAFSSIIDTYTDLMKQGHHIAGISVPHCFWADIGTVEGYLDAHREIFRRAIKKQPGGELISSAQLKRMRKIRKDNNIKGFVSIGENVDIKVGATIYDAVIGNNVKIARDADIRNAIVADNTSVHGKVRRMALPLSETADPNLFSAIDKIGLCADSATAEPLEPRGSNRTFTRIRSCSKSVIAVRYSLERPENGLYVSNARFLRNLGVRVPDVLLEREKDNLLIMEDVG
ncbi:MAG: NDP-sugar synthase, partial [Kiritimatiellae bacterium]|nr:NDP-sugar synthase [Kiritimatiellia bacterium]